ncbi:response regulator transcription factor [Carboxylicivirga sp. A043]|uniref:LytR/AlgR family response regulator transcription factor n=1 Tax=Carboxylicivirga litoralis TaxID=2816963 RepID=UPI0021CB0085|nr:LytTR family DNA-binding domain-containing protein [Carboxylicivirga sp. A043]MCU4154841.1 response regulator transcription factor [Carboxylicivirga sp. A043]
MKPVNCLVVDDESLAVDVLSEYISRLDNLHLVDTCNNAVEAIQKLNDHQVDLLFLDIQMPGLTGLQLIRNLSHRPEVIFTTAYSEYALEGFELEALDYLIKPISFERFIKAVNRYFKNHQQTEIPQNNSTNTFIDAFIFVKSDKMMVKVVLQDITHIESLRNYVSIYLSDGREIKTMNTISNIEEKLPETHFLRVHRSYIIAIDKIESYTTGSLNITDQNIPIGRNYKEQVLSILEKKSIE